MFDNRVKQITVIRQSRITEIVLASPTRGWHTDCLCGGMNEASQKIVAARLNELQEQNAKLLAQRDALIEALDKIQVAACANSYEVQLRAGNIQELVSEIMDIARAAIQAAGGDK